MPNNLRRALQEVRLHWSADPVGTTNQLPAEPHALQQHDAEQAVHLRLGLKVSPVLVVDAMARAQRRGPGRIDQAEKGLSQKHLRLLHPRVPRGAFAAGKCARSPQADSRAP